MDKVESHAGVIWGLTGPKEKDPENNAPDSIVLEEVAESGVKCQVNPSKPTRPNRAR